MSHPSRSTTIAILGADVLLAEDILAKLLEEREGYDVRLLDVSYPTSLIDELLDGVDIALFAPALDTEVGEAFLEVMRSIPKTAAIPVLSLSSALKHALLDELSAGLSWRSLCEELVQQIQTKDYKTSRAYRCGWIDGCYGEPGCFTENRRLAEWETASDRLDYYRGHRAGRETSQQRSGLLLQAP